MPSFNSDIICSMSTLRPFARRLWPTSPDDLKDGMQETICRAIANRSKFGGGNLAAWLTTIMRNVRRDQWAKGYRKGAKSQGRGDRVIYTGEAGYAHHLPDFDDPESILIAREQYAKAGWHNPAGAACEISA